MSEKIGQPLAGERMKPDVQSQDAHGEDIPLWVFYAGAAGLILILVLAIFTLYPPPAEGTIAKPWEDIAPPIRNEVGNRNPDLFNAVLDQFSVSINPRYRKNQQSENETYCNIFVWDVTKAMGAEIPHWVDENGRPVPQFSGTEQGANDMIDWLEKFGVNQGWDVVDAEGAQAMANLGKPVVATWKNPNGVGHIAMVRPGRMSEKDGPALAQAGAINSNTITVGESFGDKDVVYYYHD
jgi:hypothetical protein